MHLNFQKVQLIKTYHLLEFYFPQYVSPPKTIINVVGSLIIILGRCALHSFTSVLYAIQNEVVWMNN